MWAVNGCVEITSRSDCPRRFELISFLPPEIAVLRKCLQAIGSSTTTGRCAFVVAEPLLVQSVVPLDLLGGDAGEPE